MVRGDVAKEGHVSCVLGVVEDDKRRQIPVRIDGLGQGGPEVLAGLSVERRRGDGPRWLLVI